MCCDTLVDSGKSQCLAAATQTCCLCITDVCLRTLLQRPKVGMGRMSACVMSQPFSDSRSPVYRAGTEQHRLSPGFGRGRVRECYQYPHYKLLTNSRLRQSFEQFHHDVDQCTSRTCWRLVSRSSQHCESNDGDAVWRPCTSSIPSASYRTFRPSSATSSMISATYRRGTT